ncbi:hypothetical protein BJV82DRAFT_299057 [Fennellomyces sp. T-0311]|nr:hypothetical protein BJV82DRAFT_299057 [Fennellomyces sp. T-0311]
MLLKINSTCSKKLLSQDYTRNKFTTRCCGQESLIRFSNRQMCASKLENLFPFVAWSTRRSCIRHKNKQSDLRLMLASSSTFDGVEYDLAAIEVAKDNHDMKIITDMGKLIREGKDDLDDLIKHIANDKRGEIAPLILQIAGANCNISSVHLAADGLYITRPWHDFSLPISPSHYPSSEKHLRCYFA